MQNILDQQRTGNSRKLIIHGPARSEELASDDPAALAQMYDVLVWAVSNRWPVYRRGDETHVVWPGRTGSEVLA
jgi:hypothetical protein